MKYVRLVFLNVLLSTTLLGFAEEAPDFIGPRLPSPKKDTEAPPPSKPIEAPKVEQKVLTCQMRQRLEENGGIVNGMVLGDLDLILKPNKKEFPYELRYTITPEAGQELDLIDNDYFPMSLVAFKAADLIIQDTAKPGELNEDEVFQKRRIRYVLDFLQVVGGLYSNVDVYGYHVFSDSKELAINVVYLSKNMSVMAIAGKYYENLYACLPKKPELNTKDEKDDDNLASLPSREGKWQKVKIPSLFETLKIIKVKTRFLK